MCGSSWPQVLCAHTRRSGALALLALAALAQLLIMLSGQLAPQLPPPLLFGQTHCSFVHSRVYGSQYTSVRWSHISFMPASSSTPQHWYALKPGSHVTLLT